MPRPLLFVLSLAAGAVCATGLAACGSDDEGTIPSDVASSMIAALDQARSAEANGDCAAVEAAATEVSNAAAGLSTDQVDPEVRDAITTGAENLHELAGNSETCEPTGPTGPTDAQDEEPAPTTPTETTETTTTTTEPEEEKPPKEPKPKPEPEPTPEPQPQPPGEGQPPGPPDTGGQPPESGGVGEDDNGD